MPRIISLPNKDCCPEGVIIESEVGTSVCMALLNNNIEIEHACEMSNACTTCHVYVREGGDSIEESDEVEDDLLDKAWGLDPDSRLSCQAIVSDTDIVIEIPKYTINQVTESR
jgi:2Fe-2S ferredoxin